jgi:hypothetical protein
MLWQERVTKDWIFFKEETGMKHSVALSMRNILLGAFCLVALMPSSNFALQNDSGQAIPSKSLIQLEDPLDEPEFYCVDVPGFRANISLKSAMTVHTCKPGADDEMFSINHPSSGQIYMEAYDLCLQADKAAPGAALYLKSCSESPLQRFVYTKNETILLFGSAELCLTVAPGVGEPTGGPSHLRRDLMFQPCSEVEMTLSKWKIPGISPR